METDKDIESCEDGDRYARGWGRRGPGDSTNKMVPQLKLSRVDLSDWV